MTSRVAKSLKYANHENIQQTAITGNLPFSRGSSPFSMCILYIYINLIVQALLFFLGTKRATYICIYIYMYILFYCDMKKTWINQSHKIMLLNFHSFPGIHQTPPKEISPKSSLLPFLPVFSEAYHTMAVMLIIRAAISMMSFVSRGSWILKSLQPSHAVQVDQADLTTRNPSQTFLDNFQVEKPTALIRLFFYTSVPST